MLTPEEKEKSREDNPVLPYTVEGLKAIKNMLLDEVDRLSARVEELEMDKASNFSRRVAELITKDAAITDYNQQISRLQSNLSAILSAVEPIVKVFEWYIENNNQPKDSMCILACKTTPSKQIETEKQYENYRKHGRVSDVILTLGDLRHLVTVAAKIKGDK